MIRAPTLAGSGKVSRTRPKVIAIPAGKITVKGRYYRKRVSENIVVTIRQATRLTVTGFSSQIVTLKPGSCSSFTATPASQTVINLAWTLPVSGGVVSGLELNRRVTGSGAAGWSGNLLSSIVTSFSDTGRTAGTSYDYRLRPVSGTSFGDYSNASASTYPDQSIATWVIPAGLTTYVFDGTATNHDDNNGNPIGPSRAVQRGDVIELAQGTHARRIFENIEPSGVTDRNTDYVIIRGPAVGVALITATSGTAPIVEMNGCRFWRMDARSDTAPIVRGKRRNIRVIAGGGSSPVHIFKFGQSGSGYSQSKDCVMTTVDIGGNWTGGASGGSMIALSPNGLHRAAQFPTAWQENMIFEDLYIHDTRTEGLYIGNNPYESLDPEGRKIPLRHIKIRGCIFENIGVGAIDAKSWFGGTKGIDQFPTSYEQDSNNSIHDCEFYRCGRNSDVSANPPNAPTVSMISCKFSFYNCIIEGGGGWGLNVFSDKGTHVTFPAGISTDFNQDVFNVIIRGCGVNVSRGGMLVGVSSIGDPDTPPNSYFPNTHVFNCDFISNTGDGLQFNVGSRATSFGRNNIALGNTGQPIVWGPVVPNENSKNLINGTPDDMLLDVSGTFEAGSLNYRLEAAQPVAAGSVLGTDVALIDFVGNTRIVATADKGAYEYP